MEKQQSIRDKLYCKMNAELDNFIFEWKMKSSENLVEFAYELTYKEDILMCFENRNSSYSDEQIKALLKLKYPLDALYQEWVEYDETPMDMISNCILKFADNEIRRQNERKKNYNQIR